MSFHDFMEMALYYPELGYYTSPRQVLGRRGDYFTSPYLSPVFGTLLGRQLEQMWHLCGRGDFTIVEFGAGTGLLCHDILEYLKHNPTFYECLSYCIVEKSASMRSWERSHLREKVCWASSLNGIKDINGCIMSNELADNFAVHRVVMAEELMEVYVDYNDGFSEMLMPASNELTSYFDELSIKLPYGFCTEVNLEATQWISSVASSLKQGYVMTIDYGFPSEQLYDVRRRAGTLLCYHQHSVHDNPYYHIGEQDITSHVNFSALSHWGSKSGLANYGFTNQANFLLGLGFKDYLRRSAATEPDILSRVRHDAMLTHTMLVDMGMKYKVLIQGKQADGKDLLGLSIGNL